MSSEQGAREPIIGADGVEEYHVGGRLIPIIPGLWSYYRSDPASWNYGSSRDIWGLGVVFSYGSGA